MDKSRYKYGGKLALFMRFGTFFLTKAKQDKMKCLFQLYFFNGNLNHREILVALATVSVAISSPEFAHVTPVLREL